MNSKEKLSRYDVCCLPPHAVIHGPEMLDGNEDGRRYHFLVDMWATGVVVANCLPEPKKGSPGEHFIRHHFSGQPTYRRESRIFGRLRYRRASPVPCMTLGVEGQQSSCRKRFFFVFIMVHEACTLLSVFPVTTSSVGRD